MGARVGMLAVIATLASPASAVDVTSCRTTIPAGAVGELGHDLDCASEAVWPFSAEGVRLERGATLNLNGFTLRGDGTGVGVGCFGSGRRRPTCTVNGPGEITGFWAGLNGSGCQLVARGVLIRGNTNGIVGPLACDLEAENLNVVDNLEEGIWVIRLRGQHLIASGNGRRGILASRIALSGSAVTQNGREGVRQFSIRGRFGRIADSTVIVNDAAGDGFDIAAAGRLRLRGVRCGRSARLRYPPVVDSSDDVPAVVGSFGCIGD